jgi:hypothetical protein
MEYLLYKHFTLNASIYIYLITTNPQLSFKIINKCFFFLVKKQLKFFIFGFYNKYSKETINILDSHNHIILFNLIKIICKWGEYGTTT